MGQFDRLGRVADVERCRRCSSGPRISPCRSSASRATDLSRSSVRRTRVCTARSCSGEVVRMKSVMRDAEQLPQIAENLFVLVDELLRRDPRFFGRALDIHAVLVGAGEIRDVVAAHPLVARDHVAHDRRIRRADVRPRIRVVNRRRQVELGLLICAVRLIHGACASEANPLRNRRKRYYSALEPLSNGGVASHPGDRDKLFP